MSIDGVVVDIVTKSTHVLAKWVDARKQIKLVVGIEALMPFVAWCRDVKILSAVACLPAQPFGFEACEGGVDSAEPFVCQKG